MRASVRQQAYFWLSVQVGLPLAFICGIALLEMLASGRPVIESFINGDLYLLSAVLLFGAGLEVAFKHDFDVGISDWWMLLGIFSFVVFGALFYKQQLEFVWEARDRYSFYGAIASFGYLAVSLFFAYLGKFRVLNAGRRGQE